MKIILSILVTILVILLTNSAFAHHNKYHVKRVKTPITTVELAKVLREGHKNVFNKYPSENRLAVGWAQVGLENGQGQHVYNHNLGFITSSPKRPYFLKKHRFRAHKSFLEGATDYWNIILRMCKSSLKHFDNGHPYAAAQQLKRCGYYGADPVKYGKLMTTLYFKAKKKVIPQLNVY